MSSLYSAALKFSSELGRKGKTKSDDVGEVGFEGDNMGSSVGRGGTEFGKERGRVVEEGESVFPDVNLPLDGRGLTSFPSPLLGKGGSKIGLRIGCSTSPVAAAGSLDRDLGGARFFHCRHDADLTA